MKLLPDYEHMDPSKPEPFRWSPGLRKRWPWWRIVLWIVLLILVVLIVIAGNEYSKANEYLLPLLVVLR